MMSETEGRVTIAAVSAEQVALVPQCAECGELWLPIDDDRWRAYLDADTEIVFSSALTAPSSSSTRRAK
jgi:hypothetical protein